MRKMAKGVKALVLKEGRFLVLLEPNGDPDLPGGRLEDGEDFREGLDREILEETGLKVVIMDPLVHWSFMKGSEFLVRGVTYYCQYLGGHLTLSSEHSDHYWLELDKIGRLQWKRPFLKTERV
jgi:8-oxo-dGTP diphosphatase